jgi:protein required for attachment to host cells
MIWVIAANAIACRIFLYGRSPSRLIMRREIRHPENRLKKQDFLSDSGREVLVPRSDPKDVELDNFARDISYDIMHGRKTHAFDKLIFLTTPHMLGLISSHVDKPTRGMVINTIKKDPQHFSASQIMDILRENTRYPDVSKF